MTHRVLLLAPFPPRLDGQHGGSRTIANLVDALADQHRVAVLCLRASDEASMDPALAARCEVAEEILRPGVSYSSIRPLTRAVRLLPSLARGRPLWVAARTSTAFARRARAIASDWRPHIVQMEYHAMGQYSGALPADTPARVLSVHEPGIVAATELAARSHGAARAFWRHDLRAWRRYERELLDTVDAAVVFTQRDRDTLATLGGRAPIVEIPLTVPLPLEPLDPVGADPPGLLFIGNFLHPPNADAARLLARDIFPPLRDRRPHLQLWIVGAGGAAALESLDLRGISVTGEVPDVGPWLDRCAVVVAPIRLGGGMRVKVAEALAAGKAVVASRVALDGLAVRSGREAMVADDAPQFSAAIDALLGDPPRRTELGRAARRWAELHLGRERSAEGYVRLYERLLEGGSSTPFA